MVKKLVLNISYLAIILLTGCGPITPGCRDPFSTNPGNQAATSSFTPIPPTETLIQTPTQTTIETPTETPTTIKTPLPKPDILSLQLNLKDFLLEQSDFPLGSKYSSMYDAPVHIPNEEVNNTFVDDTERIDGWSIWYGKDYGTGGWLVVVSDEISLYNTSDGAQLAVKNYSLSGFLDETNPPKIGDKTRAGFIRPGTSSQADYVIIFSYRNLVHVVDEYGYKNEVVGDAKSFARILLARLKASPLITP